MSDGPTDPIGEVIQTLGLNALEVNALYQQICERMYVALEVGNVDKAKRALKDLLGPETPVIQAGRLH